MADISDWPMGDCKQCGKRPAEVWWATDGITMALRTGGLPWCKICIVQAQLSHAKERAVAIPGLEAELESLVRKYNACKYCGVSLDPEYNCCASCADERGP